MPNAQHARHLPLTTYLERALAHVLRPDAMTEWLTVAELAEWFHVGRHKMGQLLKDIPGVRRNGRQGLVRVPVSEMPPGYLADVVLKAVANLEVFGARPRKPLSSAGRRAYTSSP